MLNRKFAAVAIAALVLTGTTACTFTSPIATMEVYTPGDGADANAGEISARNVFVLVAPSGQTALFGSLVNRAATQQAVTVEVASQSFAFNLAAGEKLDFGFNGKNALAISGLNAKAGSLVDVHYESGSDKVHSNVPVLDATFEQYAPLVNSMSVIAPTEAPKG